jgi:hypothetical protein
MNLLLPTFVDWPEKSPGIQLKYWETKHGSGLSIIMGLTNFGAKMFSVQDIKYGDANGNFLQ